MMNVAQLDTSVHKLEAQLGDRYSEFEHAMYDKMRGYQATASPSDTATYTNILQLVRDTLDATRQKYLSQARASAFNALSDVQMYNSFIKSDKEYINRHYIEWMRKFTLSVACLLLFLIGAPFGSIVRKGGLGMPLVASVGFFVMYYVIGMISEKSVRESAVGPIGMWYSTFVFIPIGIILTWQATTDSSFFDLATWKRWLHIKPKAQPESRGLQPLSAPDSFKGQQAEPSAESQPEGIDN